MNECRFGGLLHDWPESYFKAQQSKGDGLAGIFEKAMEQHKAQKIKRTQSMLSRMFHGSTLTKLPSSQVLWSSCCSLGSSTGCCTVHVPDRTALV